MASHVEKGKESYLVEYRMVTNILSSSVGHNTLWVASEMRYCKLRSMSCCLERW